MEMSLMEVSLMEVFVTLLEPPLNCCYILGPGIDGALGWALGGVARNICLK